MTEDFAARRREYVNDIRRSFDFPETDQTEGEKRDDMSAAWIFFKIRAVAAGLLFLGFLYWNSTKDTLFGFQAASLREFLGTEQLETLTAWLQTIF